MKDQGDGLGLSGQPHDNNAWRTRWRQHRRKVLGGCFGDANTNIRDEMKLDLLRHPRKVHAPEAAQRQRERL